MNQEPADPKATGRAAAATSMAAVAVSSTRRGPRPSRSTALPAQAYWDQAHHTSQAVSPARAHPRAEWSWWTSPTSWVTAKTNTRSKNSSGNPTRLFRNITVS